MMFKKLFKTVYLYLFPFIFVVLLNRFYLIKLDLTTTFNTIYNYNLLIFIFFILIGILLSIWNILLFSLPPKEQILTVGFFLLFLGIMVFILFFKPGLYPVKIFYSVLDALPCIYLIMGYLFVSFIYFIIRIVISHFNYVKKK